jgi:hypothetical protein
VSKIEEPQKAEEAGEIPKETEMDTEEKP